MTSTSERERTSQSIRELDSGLLYQPSGELGIARVGMWRKQAHKLGNTRLMVPVSLESHTNYV